MWNEARYLIRGALGDVRRAPFAHASAALTIGLALLVAGLFAVVLGTAARLLAHWGADVQVTVYLDDAADAQTLLGAVARELSGAPAVLVDKDEALRRLRQSLGELAGALDGLEPDPLPRSIEARPPDSLDASRVRAAAARIARLPGVSEVDYGQDWLDRLQALLGLVRAAALGLGGVVAVAAVLLVQSVIQLAVYARRDEIEILQLVGATRWYVRAPFLLEGLGQGLAGGALAAAGLFGAQQALGARAREALAFAAGLPDLRFFTPAAAGALLAAGAALGLVGSAVAVARFLRP